MKFTPYQYKRIAERYIGKIKPANGKAENDKLTAKAEKHIQAYVHMTGKLPD